MPTYTEVLQTRIAEVQTLIANTDDRPSPTLVSLLAALNQSVNSASAALIPPTINLTNAHSSYSASSGTHNFTVPSGKRWQLLGGYLVLATSATSADRLVRIGYSASGNWLNLIEYKAVQAASLTRYYNFGMMATDSSFSSAGFINLNAPLMPLEAGEKYVISITGWQSGDTLTPSLKVVEVSA